MKTKQDASYGVIPYIKDEEGFKFFVIHQFSSLRNDSYWIFPKGHPEEGETAEETARRELIEETQITLQTLHSKPIFEIAYNFVHDGVRIEKTVTFFLGLAASEEHVLDEREVKEAGWFPYTEARKKITYEHSKQILDQAVEYLLQ